MNSGEIVKALRCAALRTKNGDCIKCNWGTECGAGSCDYFQYYYKTAPDELPWLLDVAADQLEELCLLLEEERKSR